MMDFTSFTTIYSKEIRAWRHRFWWLPLAGAMVCLLPMTIAKPPQMSQPPGTGLAMGAPIPVATTDADRQFLEPPVPRDVLAWVVGGLCVVTSLLALWLAREFRGAEVRDGTLLDVALTTIRPLGFVTAQILAAWTVAAMPLMGALPVLLPFGIRMGITVGGLLWGVVLLLTFLLIGACLGYGALWWRRVVILASRGRSLRLWLLPFAIAVVLTAIACGVPITYPMWKKYQSNCNRMRTFSGEPPFNQSPPTYLTDTLLSNFVLGVFLLALLYVAFIVARSLWRARWKGRLALLLFVPSVVWLGWKAPSLLSKWTDTIPRDIGLNQYESFLMLPFISLLNAITACGGSLGGPGEWADGFDAPNAFTLGGLVYWLGVALLAFLFALEDTRWVMRQPWLVTALQRPETAPFMLELGGKIRRRRGLYDFGVRNPVYDYLMARSSGSRITAVGWFAVLVIGTTGGLYFVWDVYLNGMPATWGMSEDVLRIPWGIAVGLCALCGLNCGATISQLKMSGQWGVLLSLPLKSRSLHWAVCFPRFVDALLVAVLAFSLGGIGVGFNFIELKQFIPFAVAMGMAFAAFAVTSVFASAFTKSTAKAMVLCVILSALLLGGLTWLGAWLDGRSTQQMRNIIQFYDAPWMFRTRPATEYSALTVWWWKWRSLAVPSAIGAAVLLFLSWWSSRRLNKER